MYKKLLLAVSGIIILTCGCKKAKDGNPAPSMLPFYINVDYNSDTSFILNGRFYKIYLDRDLEDGRCSEANCSCPGGGYWCDTKTYVYNAKGTTLKINTEVRGCMLYDSLSYIDPLYDLDTSFHFQIQQVKVLPYPDGVGNLNLNDYVATYLIYPQ